MDCNDTKVFLKEWRRMCDAVGSCENCKLWKDKMPCVNNMGMFKNEPKKAIAVVQEWSDQHPVRTRLSVFLEQYPNCRKCHDGMPITCAGYLYDRNCVYTDGYKDCWKCWNIPIEGVQ